MPDQTPRRNDEGTGASAPEASLIAREARATTPGVEGDLHESAAGRDPVAIDRVDARGAALGTAEGEADPGEEAATTGGLDPDAGAALDDDPLTRS